MALVGLVVPALTGLATALIGAAFGVAWEQLAVGVAAVVAIVMVSWMFVQVIRIISTGSTRLAGAVDRLDETTNRLVDIMSRVSYDLKTLDFDVRRAILAGDWSEAREPEPDPVDEET